MRVAAIVRLLLAGLLTGLLLPAQHGAKPGGDGGVVILPAPVAITDEFGTEAPEVSTESDSGGGVSSSEGGPAPVTDETSPVRLRVSFSLAQDDAEEDQAILIAIPAEMVDAYAIILAGDVQVPIPARIVSNHLEIDTQTLRTLSDLSVERLEVLVVSANGLVIRMAIDIDSENDQADVTVY